MRLFFLFILQLLFIYNGIAQKRDAQSNALGGCGLTQNSIWSNFSNQAGLANVNELSFGLGTKKQFLVNELSSHNVACAIPVNGGVIGINLNYFGFDLYNETKIGLAFGKKLSNSLNIGLQIDYLGKHINEGSNNLHNFTFEIGLQKQLSKKLILGTHIFNPTTVKLNKYENIPSFFRLGFRYNANKKVYLFTEGSLESNQNSTLHIGIEYKIIQELVLRSGFQTNPAKNSFGVGYSLNEIQIDITVNKHQVLGYSPQISASSRF